MDIPNAFIGKKVKPTTAEVAAALAKTAALWQQLVDELAERRVTFQEWVCLEQKYGWSLRLKRNKRTIVHMEPCKDCFRVLFILGDKALAAVPQSDLPPRLRKQIEDAPFYSEGAGIRLVVKAAPDLPAVLKLATLKLEN
jgi:hypothetical protein